MTLVMKAGIVGILAAAVFLIVATKGESKLQKVVNRTGTSETRVGESALARLPRILDLGSDKCIPCKMMLPVLAELRKTYTGKLRVDFIDVWKNPSEGGKYKIDSIPTQIFYDTTGMELYRHTGFYGRQEIVAKMKELGFGL